MVPFSDILKKDSDKPDPQSRDKARIPKLIKPAGPEMVSLPRPEEKFVSYIKIPSHIPSDKIRGRPLPSKVKLVKPYQEKPPIPTRSIGTEEKERSARTGTTFSRRDHSVAWPAPESQERKAAPPSPAEITSAEAIKTLGMFEDKEAEIFYNRLSETVKTLLDETFKKRRLQEFDINNALKLIKETVEFITTGGRNLLDMTYRYSPENFLISHVVNVCIVSIEIGRGMGYNKSKLEELGLAAFFHDIGLKEIFSSFTQEGRSNSYDPRKTKKVIVQSSRSSGDLEKAKRIILHIAHSHPSREPEIGQAPTRDEELYEYRQIIGLVATFESVTHPRPYRKRIPPQIALKELTELACQAGAGGKSTQPVFDRNIIKILIKRIGLYPVGSWVEFNTNEIARVARVNEKFPLRPVVSIVFDANKKKKSEIKILDLMKNQNIYIKSIIDENELDLPAGRFVKIKD